MKVINDSKTQTLLAEISSIAKEKKLLLKKIVSKYKRLSLPQKLLLLETTFWMIVVAIMLKVIKTENTSKVLSRLVKSRPNKHLPEEDDTRLADLLVSIHLATGVIRRPKCLLNALMAQILLGRRGYVVKTKIGITRKSGGQVEAHAWVERNGEVIVGGKSSPSCYIPVDGSAGLFDRLFQV